jgi:hypothetical protein
MALVEMGVHVDEGRKDHRAAHVDGDRLRFAMRPSAMEMSVRIRSPSCPRRQAGTVTFASVTPPWGIVRKSIRFPG